jgi:hypothetical protein
MFPIPFAFLKSAGPPATIYYIESPQPANQQFGNRPRLSGDGLFLIVGHVGASKIFVYKKTAPTWTLIYTYTLPGASGARCVGINSDGTKLIAGDVAAVHYFTRSGDTVTRGGQVSSVGGTPIFGSTCDMASNGSFVTSETDYASNTCIFSFFTWTGAAPVRSYDRQADDKVTSANFGATLSISYDGTKIACKGGSGVANKIYIFKNNITSATTEGTISPPSGQSTWPTSLDIGTTKGMAGHSISYSAYLLRYNGSSWSIIDTKTLTSGDNFGRDVAISGDENKALVGSYSYFAATNSGGSSFSYNISTNLLVASKTLEGTHQVSGGRFGYFVDLNYLGDALVSGFLEDEGFTDSGSLYFFDKSLL